MMSDIEKVGKGLERFLASTEGEGVGDKAARLLERLSPESRQTLGMKPGVWAELGLDEQDELEARVGNDLEGYVKFCFEETGAKWLVIAGEEATVVMWSATRSSPSEDLMREIQAQQGTVPFLFVRELEVDGPQLTAEAA